VITALKSTRVAKLTKHEVVHRSVAVVFCFLCLLATSMIVGGVCVGQQKEPRPAVTTAPTAEKAGQDVRAPTGTIKGRVVSDDGRPVTGRDYHCPSRHRRARRKTGARRRRRKIRFRRFAGSRLYRHCYRSGLHRSIDGGGRLESVAATFDWHTIEDHDDQRRCDYRYGHKSKGEPIVACR